MDEKLMKIKEELIAKVDEMHHHDADFSSEEGYHLHEGEIFEDEIKNAINEVFQANL